MSRISTVSALGFAGADDHEELLSGVAQRAADAIDPIDEQVLSATRRLETTTERTEELHAKEEVLQAVMGELNRLGGKSTDQRALHDLSVTLTDGRCGPADELLREAGVLDLVDPAGTGKASSSTVEVAVGQVRSSREKINSGNQLEMIQLQELMHQKNLLLQLATQELSSREQIERRIAENIR